MEQVKVFASVLTTILLKWSGEEFKVVEGESELCKKVWKLGIGRCYSSSLENSWYLWQILRKSGFLGDKYRQRRRLKSKGLIRKINECIHIITMFCLNCTGEENSCTKDWLALNQSLDTQKILTLVVQNVWLNILHNMATLSSILSLIYQSLMASHFTEAPH